jgi:hypothetical protein
MSLAQLFFARERLRRRARDLAWARRARRRSPLVFEPLEGRLLLSATVVPNDVLLASTLPALIEPLEPTPTPSPAAASPVNVDAFVDVTRSGLILDRATGTFDSRATITNVSADETLQAPMRLVVTSITSAGGVTLANAGGETEEGDPFVEVSLPGGELGPGAVVGNVLLKFANLLRVHFTFTTSVEAVPEAGDADAPDISAALANDTGRDDADGITFDPTVRGTVTDAGAVAAFRAGLDGTPAGAFTDVLPSLGPGGAFTLDAAALVAINGGPLAEGDHTLHLVATDDAGNTSPILSLSFLLDTKAPVAPAFDLDPASDTPPVGDQATTLASVDLDGQTEAGAEVTLLETGDVTTADGNGSFTFAGVDLALGANPFTARAVDLAGNQSDFALTLTGLAAAEAPFMLADHTPLDGADGVGIGVRPKIVFSEAVDPATVTGDAFFATAAGTTLPATVVVDASGLFARLFFTGPMPGGAAMQVRVDGSAIRAAADGEQLDADGDGVPGGVLTFDFTTLSTVALPGTTLSGRLADAGPDLVPLTADDTLPGPDGDVGTPDDVILTPIVGARIFVRGLEDEFVLTGADGAFHFDAVPGGPVTLALRGETATAPPGFTYPELTADLQMTVGIDNAIGTIYMPRLASEVVQTVDTSATTILTLPPGGAPGLTEEQRQQFTLEIPAGGLLGPDGQPVASAQVVMSVVPTGTLAPFLPPTLPEPTFAFTTQLRGATDLASPFRATFPNVSGAPLGTVFSVLSFDPVTGRLVQDGTATVVAADTSPLRAAGVGAAGDLTQQAALEGDLVISWTPSPFSALAACFHLLGPNLTPIGPPCPPTIGTVEIPPVPDFSPLVNRLFTRDDGSFSLSFTNAAEPIAPTADPCAAINAQAIPLVVDIDVDGPAGAFLEGLQSMLFSLLPGETEQLDIEMKDFAPVLKTLTADQLYAVHVHVTAFAANNPGDLKVDEKFAIARYVPVVDPAGEAAVFLKTLGDGTGGFVRGKRVDYHLPVEVDTTFTELDPFMILDQDGPLFGEGATTWLFDPVATTARSTRVADATITVGQEALPERLRVQGTVVARTTISPNRADFETLLRSFLDESRHYTPTPGFFLASQAFIDEFRAGIPFFNGGTLTQNQLNAREVKIHQTSQALVAAVRADFDPANDGFLGYLVVDNDTDVVATWHPVVSDAGGPVGGLGEYDWDADRLLAALPDPNLPDVAKEWVFAESLNESAANAIDLSFDIHAARWNNKAPFPAFVANSVSHEHGHTFGLNEAYLNTPDKAIPVPPNDIMSSGNPNMLDRAFADTNVDTLRAAIGLAPDAPGALASAIQMYRRNFNLPKNTAPIMPIEPEGDTTPALAVRAGADDLFSGDLLAAGTVLADGVGGAAATRILTLTNVGQGPMTIGALAFADGGAGFSLAGPSPTGTVLDIGESVTVNLVFDPTSAGAFADTLSIESDAPGNPFTLALAGDGLTTAGRISATLARDPLTGAPVQNNVGGLALGAAPRTVDDLLTLRNIGGGPLTITAVSVTGEAAAQFAVGGLPPGFGPANPLVLAPGETFALDLTFDAAALGLQRAQVEIASNDPVTPVLRQTVVGTGLADQGSALEYGHDFVAVELPQQPNTPVARKVSDAGGNWTFLLASGQSFHDAIFDPASGLIAHGFGVTASSGVETDVLTPVFAASTAPDRDGDGLPDDVEFAVGTSVASVDSDADGVDDFAELRAGLDPLDPRGTATGVVGGLRLDGEAWDIATAGSVAYVATGSHGLAIVDISDPSQPILLGSRDLTGSNVSVAVDEARGLAAVASHLVEPGLHIVDVSDPAHPVTQRTVALPDGARHVEVLDGVAFVASGTALVAIELVSGDVLQTLDLGGALTGLAREGETLFAMDQAGTLTAVDISGAQMVALDTLAVANGGGELFVGGGIAYLAAPGAVRGGFATVDVSDPADLTLISDSDVAAGFRPDHAVAADGSAHALIIGNVPNPSNPFLTIDVVDVADVTDPADTDAFLARFVVPEFPLGITPASGVALIADGDADLLVIGYESADTAGQAPDVSIRALVDDADPTTPGIQVAPDSRIHVLVEATDDVLVRGVEILVNGQPVGSDTSFPYEALLTAGDSAGPMTVQARATDTGGNVGLSNTLVFQVAVDTVAPTIVAIDPADGATAPEELQQVTVRFSEALAPASVSASTFRVVTGGQPVAPLGIDLLSEGRLVELRFAGLAAGDYQLVIDADAVTDLAGNALGPVDVVSEFTLTGEAVTWINPAGGFWDDPANWSGGVLPGPNDNVLIDVPGEVTITHRTGLTIINRLISRESLALTGGTLDVTTTLQVDGAFTLAFSGTGTTLRHATVLPGASGQDVLITTSATLDDVTLAADLTVANLGTANVRNGLTLDGARVTLASDGGPTLLLFDSDQTLDGTGEVFFGGSGNDNGIDVDGILTIGSGITIRGSQSGGLGETFTNETIVLEGTVLAETAGETIGIGGIGASSWVNRGLVRATNGGRLELGGTFTLEDGGTFSSASGGAVVLVGTLDNTGRTLALTTATGSLQVDGGTIQGGRVETTGGAALVPQTQMTLDGVTLGSNFSIPDAATVLVQNGLTLDAVTVTLLDGTVPFISPRIRFDGTQAIGGNGDLVFGGTADDATIVAGSGSTLTIGSGITIHGPRGGSVGVLGAVANQGTISAAVSGREITVSGSSVTNVGTIEALNGGRILLAGGQFTNTGDVTVGAGSTARVLSGTYLQTAGETSLAGGTLWADTVSLQGGVLSGFGTVRGTVSVSLINAALLDLGAPTGTLQVNGTYQQTAAGVLNVGLGGTAAGQFDRLQITGAATLGGTLNVALVGAFLPAVGNTFEILTFASRTSDFATVTGLSLPNGNTLQYSPEATRVRLITTV